MHERVYESSVFIREIQSKITNVSPSMVETNTTLKSNLPPGKKLIKKEKDITLPLPE